MSYYNIFDERFKTYGRVASHIDFNDMITVAKEIPITDDIYYLRSFDKLEECHSFSSFQDSVFGGLEIEAGYCVGCNDQIDSMEYHKSSEINIAVAEMLITVGEIQDIEAERVPYSSLDSFSIPAGTAVELFSAMLHYAPCRVEQEGYCGSGK